MITHEVYLTIIAMMSVIYLLLVSISTLATPTSALVDTTPTAYETQMPTETAPVDGNGHDKHGG